MTDRKEMDRIKSEFIATVSHELRTPLTSIMGSLRLIAGGVGGKLSAQTTSLLDISRKNAERLVRLINDILDIEKIEAGKMQFSLQVRELMPLVVNAMEANRDYAQQFGIGLNLVSELPGVFVSVDDDRFLQVLTNLLSNAAKFSPRDSDVRIAVTRTEKHIRVSVSDCGSGIPDQFREKIFQKFSQADSSDKRQKGGTGLGLSISKAIIENMNGLIGFTSNHNIGTTFFVDLLDVTSSMGARGATVDAASAANDRVAAGHV